MADISASSNTYSVLIAGFGDIGQRIARELNQLDTILRIYGIKRSLIASEDAELILWDMNDAPDIQLPEVDYVIFCTSADALTEAGYQRSYIDAQANLIEKLAKQSKPLRRYFFCSSTSCYGQKAHEVISEDSETTPTRFTGVKMLEAEATATKNVSWPVTSIRATGLYGPGRQRMISQVYQGNIAESEPVCYSNRIHVDDLARFYAHLIQQDISGQKVEAVYLASDDLPVPLHEVQEWLAAAMNINQLNRVAAGRTGSKQISNQRMKDSGFALRYPSYKEGMMPLIADFLASQS